MKPLADLAPARDVRRRGASDAAFVGVLALCFAASAAATIAMSASMAAMGGLPMPGGGTLSMAWMAMCGQTWAGVAASFAGMWIAMTVTMMLPSLLPVLWRCHRALDDTRPPGIVALVGAGYFAVWTACGIVAFAGGVALTSLVMRVPGLVRAVPALLTVPAMPVSTGIVMLLVGVLQFSTWKARHLGRCRARAAHGCALPADRVDAWRHGLRLGRHCCCCCANLTLLLLAFGMMDLRAMALVTLAITGERVTRNGERVARMTGAVLVGAGMLLIARSAGMG